MKEIQRDDSVFVISRNVDVLISKLRKRLSADPAVKIVNNCPVGEASMTKRFQK